MEFKAVVPAGLTDAATLQKIVTNQMRMVAKSVAVDFIATTYTWKRRPDFVINEIDVETITIGTDNDIWKMIDVGTRPHVIRVKYAKALRFQWGGFGSYKAKTIPRQFRSNKGKISGPINYRKSVKHPGFVARDFTDAAAVKYQRLLPGIIQRAINSAVR
jgi:hypothetical protein